MTNKVKLLHSKILSDLYYTLKQDTFQFMRHDGMEQEIKRIVFDRGHGAAILLYSLKNQTVILTRQFRYPVYYNGNHNGMMIEVCAGVLDEDSPEDCIKRETVEETGYNTLNLNKVMEIHPSPGAVSEIVHLFTAEYSEKVTNGGGLIEEGEDIEVLEYKLSDAIKMISNGEITDAKTIILLQYAQLHLF